jgi:uncharacterized protein involved in response to NO
MHIDCICSKRTLSYAMPAAGAMTGMIGMIGMITRTARGHTGRTLEAERPEVATFALLPLAVGARLGTNLSDGPARAHALALSAALWSLAFVIYLLRYGPWLATRPCPSSRRRTSRDMARGLQIRPFGRAA